MPYIRRIVLVCGYTCRPIDQVPEAKRYLDRIVRHIIETDSRYLVLSGGPTQQKSQPGWTEARRMADYIVPRVPFKLSVVLEERSFTTFENIKNGSRHITQMPPPISQWRGSGPREDEVTVWCEGQRSLKVVLLARHFIRVGPGRLIVESVPWELGSPVKELKSTVLDWLCCRIPGLYLPFRWWRMWRARTR